MNANGIYTIHELVLSAEQRGFASCERRWLVPLFVKGRINSRNARGKGTRAKKRAAKISR